MVCVPLPPTTHHPTTIHHSQLKRDRPFLLQFKVLKLITSHEVSFSNLPLKNLQMKIYFQKKFFRKICLIWASPPSSRRPVKILTSPLREK